MYPNVGKTTVNHPPVITIFIGDRKCSPDGWLMMVLPSLFMLPSGYVKIAIENGHK